MMHDDLPRHMAEPFAHERRKNFLPALIGGAVGLIGGALNRRSAKNQQAAGAANDRAMYDLQRSHFKQDRTHDKKYAERIATETRDSRGVDFQRLRDEAQAAGFNPATALGTAGLYSTELGYAPASAGGSAGMGPVMGSAGASRQFDPALSSGGFIADAIGRAADTYFNTPPKTDPLADALRTAMNTNNVVHDAVTKNYRQPFGFDLTEVEPYRPAQRSGTPAFSSDSMPAGEIEVGGRKYVPVQLPDGQFGQLDKSIAERLDIKPFDTVSAGDWAEIVGEVGEVETAILQNPIRRTALGPDRSLVSPSSGRLGYGNRGASASGRSAPKSQSHHFNPWNRN